MTGERDAFRYAQRDLPILEQVIAMTRGRTVCVQAGGSLGVWPKRLARDFSTVLTFEPAADSFAALCRHADEPNIVKTQAALGDAQRLVGLSRERRDGKPNQHPGITHVSGAGAVQMLTIDDLSLGVCDLIYLDIEGYELYALRGAEQTLRQCRPLVAVEINKSIGYVGQSGAELRAFIEALGYAVAAELQSDVVFAPKEWQ